MRKIFSRISQLGFQKHHIVLGMSGFAIRAVVLVLFVSTKSTKVRATEKEAIEIERPISDSNAELPKAELVEAPQVRLVDYDGIPVGGIVDQAIGLYKTPSVLLTDELASFALSLSNYFARTRTHATITSGFRTS